MSQALDAAAFFLWDKFPVRDRWVIECVVLRLDRSGRFFPQRLWEFTAVGEVLCPVHKHWLLSLNVYVSLMGDDTRTHPPAAQLCFSMNSS